MHYDEEEEDDDVYVYLKSSCRPYHSLFPPPLVIVVLLNYEFLPVFRNDHEGMIASTQVALAELLMSGVTTVVDLSIPYEGWLDVLGESGLRAVAAPMFRDARWLTKNGHELSYEWDTKEGQKSFDGARQVENVRSPQSGG